ncbi:reverse transcriptase domain-containing protein [Tanacetum coccineum]
MVPATTSLVGFNGEIKWPLGQITLLVKVGDDEHSTSTWMDFMVVRSTSPFNGIIGRPGLRKMKAVPSTTHGMIKFPVMGGIQPPPMNKVKEERIKVAINPEHPEQTVMIGFDLTEKTRSKLCNLLQHSLDIFAWTPTDMTGVPRQIAEHKLNVRKEEQEELIVYLAASKEAVSAVLMTEMEARPEEEGKDDSAREEEPLPGTWQPCFHGMFHCLTEARRVILTDPEGVEFTYALRFPFETTNNEAEYEALIAGLRIAEKMGVKNLEVNVDSKLVANQVNGTYIAKETDMVKYLEKVLMEELKEKSIKEKEVLAVVEEEGDTWMTPIHEYLTDETLPTKRKKARAIKRKSQRFAIINGILYKKSFLGSWLRCVGPSQANYVLREIHEGSCSMHAGTRSVVAKALRTGEIISDNGKQFRDNPFKDWCEKLCIQQHFAFASVKQSPRRTDQLKRATEPGERIKARLGKEKKTVWKEISHVLLVHTEHDQVHKWGHKPYSITVRNGSCHHQQKLEFPRSGQQK